jgi:heme-degrading monooxygenase HmoA
LEAHTVELEDDKLGVVRSWSALATRDGALAYVAFFRNTLVPQLGRIPGHRGALVLRRPAGDVIEITVLTFWESMDAVKRFAGDPPDRAVVEPEGRAILLSFDEHVKHLEIGFSSLAPPMQ